MRRYLLDSGIFGDLINERHDVPARYDIEVAKGNKVGIGIPVLAEIVFGIENGQNRDRNMRSLLSALPSVRVWPFDNAAAFRYGELAAHLRRIGRVIQTNDIMIAAIALTLGHCTVVTKDSDLGVIPGLTIEDWSVPPAAP